MWDILTNDIVMETFVVIYCVLFIKYWIEGIGLATDDDDVGFLISLFAGWWYSLVVTSVVMLLLPFVGLYYIYMYTLD